MQNVYVADENDTIVAVAVAGAGHPAGADGQLPVPVRRGIACCWQVSWIPCAPSKSCGVGFTVAVPADAAQAALLRIEGFAQAFALRCLPREVSRNLWSQAEFDTVTAQKLCELREQFWKDTVQLSPERMAVVLQDLYSRGATIVSNEHGYGIYFRKEDTLYFVEMMADSDRAAEILMEAARERKSSWKGCHHGRCCPAAVSGRGHPAGIRHDTASNAEPFDVSESYLRLMLEN